MVLLFKGQHPRVNSQPLLLGDPHPGRTMLVFKAELMYVLKPVGGAKGGGCLHHVHCIFPKKKGSLRALRAHNVRMYTSGASPTKGTKSEVARSPLPSRGPKSGQKCYITPTFSGVPQQRGQNQKRLHHPCLGKVDS